MTEDVDRMRRFYEDVLGLSSNVDGLPKLEKGKGYAGDVAFLSDGKIQMHLAQKDIHAGFKTGQAVNPVSRGHVAYRTSDLEAVKETLTAAEIPFSDWGHTAVDGWHQIFFYDPDGNVVEVHQVSSS